MTSALARIADPSRTSPEARFVPIVLKTRKSRASENLANVAHWRFQPLQASVESIRAPAIVFAVATFRVTRDLR